MPQIPLPDNHKRLWTAFLFDSVSRKPSQAGSDASPEARAWIENWRQGNVTYSGSASGEPSFVNPLAGFKWPWQQNVRLAQSCRALHPSDRDWAQPC